MMIKNTLLSLALLVAILAVVADARKGVRISASAAASRDDEVANLHTFGGSRRRLGKEKGKGKGKGGSSNSAGGGSGGGGGDGGDGGDGNKNGDGGFACNGPLGVNCAIFEQRGVQDRNSGGYQQNNIYGIYEPSPCKVLTTELIIEFSSAPWDQECYQPNGCAGLGKCCRITETAVCDSDAGDGNGGAISTPPCICSDFTIGGLFGNFTNSTDGGFQ